MDYVTSQLDKPEIQCVRALLIDFSKAFDTVDHYLVMSKIANLNLPPNIHNWILSFLTNRSQVTKVNGMLSQGVTISRGIVQGSALGPFLFLAMISDLKPGSPNCCMVKYADDVTILIPEPTTDIHSTVCSEFNNAKSWSHTNKLLINVPKCKEVALCKPSIKLNIISNSHCDVELLRYVTLLGVTIDSKLK